MTFLQLVNAVLRRLRENEVSAVGDTEYSTLIGDLVNETKREVEDAYDWRALYTSVDVTTAAGDNGYTLTNMDRRARIIDVYNVSEQIQIRQIPVQLINYYNTVATPQQESVLYYNVSGFDTTSDDLTITVYPTPNAIETLRFYAYNPQADLSADADVLKVPSQPVVDGTWARAISERGEDGGRMSDAQFGIYRSTLADYIAIEAGRNPQDLVWERI